MLLASTPVVSHIGEQELKYYEMSEMRRRRMEFHECLKEET
jgi:hypothetical protein